MSNMRYSVDIRSRIRLIYELLVTK